MERAKSWRGGKPLWHVIADVLVVVAAIGLNVIYSPDRLAVAGLALLYAFYRVVRFFVTGSAYPPG